MGQLEVTIVEGEDLKKKDLFSESDAFVKMSLQQDHNLYQTKVIRNNRDPRWNEKFVL